VKRVNDWGSDDDPPSKGEGNDLSSSGAHGEAKAQHGLHRATRRGLANMRMQAYLTAAGQDLKRIANALSHALCGWAWSERFTTNRRTDRLSTLSAIKFFASTNATLHAA
jgi:hypothetical protein